MSTKPTTGGVQEAETRESGIELMDRETVQELHDEPGREGTRFLAVAKTVEMGRAGPLKFPQTHVAYVDPSGEYAVERSFVGRRDGWGEIPRSVDVTDKGAVTALPPSHQEQYAEVLELYGDVEITEEAY